MATGPPGRVSTTSKLGQDLRRLGTAPVGSHSGIPKPYLSRDESEDSQGYRPPQGLLGQTRTLRRVSSASSFAKDGGFHAGFTNALVMKKESDDEDNFDKVFDTSVERQGLSRRPSDKKQEESIFARRGEKDLRSVDQSVNLMDVEAGNYQGKRFAKHKKRDAPKERQPSLFQRMLSGRKLSMREIDLGPDPSKRRQTATTWN